MEKQTSVWNEASELVGKRETSEWEGRQVSLHSLPHCSHHPCPRCLTLIIVHLPPCPVPHVVHRWYWRCLGISVVLSSFWSMSFVVPIFPVVFFTVLAIVVVVFILAILAIGWVVVAVSVMSPSLCYDTYIYSHYFFLIFTYLSESVTQSYVQ